MVGGSLARTKKATAVEVSTKQFPEWVVRKEGIPLLLESDWNGSPGVFGRKYGALLVGAGAALGVDVDHFSGGTRSGTMLTGSTISGDLAEIKTHIPYYHEGKIAFEMKFLPAAGFTGNNFDFGIEPREDAADGFWQGRARYNVGTDEWQLETTQDVYQDFDLIAGKNFQACIIEQPAISALNGAGDDWGWARMVIDSIKKEYVSFEAACVNAPKNRFYDLTGLPLVTRGSATKALFLIFILGITGSANGQTFYTTDWCISKID